MAAMGAPSLEHASNNYLSRTVQDLFSLRRRVTVITGGGRGIGLALGVACAEAGSHVAVIDHSDVPHEHFHMLQKDYGVNVKFYKCVAYYLSII